MDTIGSVYYAIRARTDQLKGDTEKAEKQLKDAGVKGGAGMEKGVESGTNKIRGHLSNTKKLVGAFLGAFVVQKIVSFFGDAVQAASEFEDIVAASAVTFGEEAMPAMLEWAEGAAEAFGASKRDAMEAAFQFAQFGKDAGLVGDDLAGFAMELTELAGDLASFTGKPTEQAITAVGAALRGEMEPLRNFGVSLDDQTLRQKAFEMGLISTTKNALTPQQKVLAAYQVILDKTGDAQGDFGRTSDSFANTQRTLREELENVTIEIGTMMLPVMTELAQFARDVLVPALAQVIEGVKNLGNSVSAKDIPIIGDLERILNGVSDFSLRINDEMFGVSADIAEAAEEMGLTYEELRERVRNVMERTGVDHDEALARVTGTWRAAGGEIATILPESIKQATAGTGPAIDEGMAGVPDAISDPVAAGADGAVYEVDNMFTRIAQTIKDKEDALREAHGDAVEAWLNSETLNNQYTILQADMEEAEADLVDARANGTAAQIAEAENRYLELVAEEQKLALELASIGDERTQLSGLQALLTSDAMLEGLASEDPEIKNLYEGWKTTLEDRITELQGNVRPAARTVGGRYAAGLFDTEPGVVDAADALRDASRPAHLNLYNSGYSVGATWAQGLWDSASFARTASWEVAMAGGSALVAYSPPKEGPLRNIDKNGMTVGFTWGEGLLRARDRIRANAYAAAQAAREGLSAMLSPNLGFTGSAAPLGGLAGAATYGLAAATAGGLSGGITVNMEIGQVNADRPMEIDSLGRQLADRIRLHLG